jgi:hypothetical protein
VYHDRSLCNVTVLFDALQIPAGMTGIQWTPVDSTGMRPESTGIHRNGTGIHCPLLSISKLCSVHWSFGVYQ